MNEVEEVKQRLDIVEVIGQYVPLKPAGRNFKGLSPFKAEKNPSFIVSPDKGIWHDFSSGEGGDVISFVMRVEGLEFPEALEMLARRAGVELKPKRQASAVNKGPSKPRLYQANELAMKYFHLCLSKNQSALEYLTKKRGLSKETIKRFRLGYSPDSWDSFRNYASKRGFSDRELKAAGLVGLKTGRAKGYDIFRGRIMFPIFDAQGRVVGFSARILKDDPNTAKYLNTPQTPAYDKSNVIYGLFQAKAAILQSDQVVIVEGNVDVIVPSQAGFANVVAVSGTAMTDRQLVALSRLSQNLLICFDADEAGQKATQRAIELAIGLDLRLSVMDLGKFKDPDDLIKADPKAWEIAIKSAKYGPDYLIDTYKKQFGVSTAVGKKQFAKAMLPWLRLFADEVEQSHYIKTVAQILDVAEDSIRQALQRQPVSKLDYAQKPTPSQNPEARRLTRQESLEEALLELLLARPETREVLEDVKTSTISPSLRPVFAVLKNKPRSQLGTLSATLPQRPDYVKILSLRGEKSYSDLSEHDAGLEAHSQVLRLNQLQNQLNKRRISRAVAEAEAAGDTQKANQLLQQYQALLNQE